MSLGVTVGAPAMYSSCDPEGESFARAQVAGIREVLLEHGLPPHSEPAQLPALDWDGALQNLRYPDVQQLQRIAAGVELGTQAPLAYASNYGRSWVGHVALLGTNHLVAHSSQEGWFVPLDFSRVIVDPRAPSRFQGGLLGSSQRLLAALRACSDILESSSTPTAA